MKSRVRIIGGHWGGRKLAVIDAPGLRPTPDRIRETLFNWLSDYCRGAQVLDCFAGTGALGFEALSRGAKSLVALEQQSQAVSALRAEVERLQAPNTKVIAGDALRSIANLDDEFDLVFIDPPYAQPGLRCEVFEQLEARGSLKEGALIYFNGPSPKFLTCLRRVSSG